MDIAKRQRLWILIILILLPPFAIWLNHTNNKQKKNRYRTHLTNKQAYLL